MLDKSCADKMNEVGQERMPRCIIQVVEHNIEHNPAPSFFVNLKRIYVCT